MSTPTEASTEDALATVAQLEVWSKEVGLTPDAELFLTLASGVVRDYCDWHVAPVRTTTATVRGGSPLFLPTLRLRALEEVSVGGLVQDLGGYEPDEDGTVWARMPVLGSRTRVRFSHGHDEAPTSVRAVVLALATRMLVNPGSVTQESLAGYAVTYSASSGGLLPVEEKILDRHRLPPRP